VIGTLALEFAGQPGDLLEIVDRRQADVDVAAPWVRDL
jgi:hypothetical protein